ncbi:MAG: hypothetical protein JJ899_07475 [Alphaproteobacteria bacterium]|nr:hypothetical protein [Alphaproteobacteria bacterium]
MSLVQRKIHALVLAFAMAIALGSFAVSGAIAQTTLLYEDRAADAKVGEVFEADGRFEIRWSATGGKFLVKVVDQNDIELISSAPQSREDDAGPMTGNMPFTGPGNFKIVVEASGPWHVRVVSVDG